MNMPTPCTECSEKFDLQDGRGGLTHKTSDITICQSCYDNQETEKERVDKIRDLLETKEDKESEIEEHRQQIDDAEQNKSNAESELNGASLELEELNYVGDGDDYHEAIERYY